MNPSDVTVLVALGMHRLATAEELRTKLGDLEGRLSVEQAQGAEEAQYASPGVVELENEPSLPLHPDPGLPKGSWTPISSSPPGSSSHTSTRGTRVGGKTVAIGCAGQSTIRHLHGIPILDHPGTRVGNLSGNPLRRVIAEVSALCRLAFVCNVGIDGGGGGACSGRPAGSGGGGSGGKALPTHLGAG